MNEFKMDAPEQEPDWSVRMREVHSDQLKRVRAEARALIEQMREALKPFSKATIYFEPEENDGTVFEDELLATDVTTIGELRVAKTALTAADEWLKANP